MRLRRAISAIAFLAVAVAPAAHAQYAGDRVRVQLTGLRAVVDTVDHWSTDSLHLRSGAALDRNSILRTDVWRPQPFRRTAFQEGAKWSTNFLLVVAAGYYSRRLGPKDGYMPAAVLSGFAVGTGGRPSSRTVSQWFPAPASPALRCSMKPTSKFPTTKSTKPSRS